MQAESGAQPLPYSGMPQFIQPIYPGFNGPSQQTSYNGKVAMGLGITQMLIGITCVILNSVLIAFNCCDFISFIAYGIWGGILILVAGLLQVLSAKKVENRCLIIGTMVMTILASCASAVIVGFSIDGAIRGDNIRNYKYRYAGYSYYSHFNDDYATIHFGIGIALVILAVIEALIAITTSALCCGAVCCKSSSMRPIPVYIVGTQSMTFQSNYPGIVLPPGRTPISGEQSSSQMPFYRYPQVSGNPGLSSNPPPTYENNYKPGTE